MKLLDRSKPMRAVHRDTGEIGVVKPVWQIKAIAATKFKGVRSRPASNNMNDCALVAAKLAWKNGCDYYVIPAAYGMVISPAKDAENTYRDFGHGVRLTANGELFANPLSA